MWRRMIYNCLACCRRGKGGLNLVPEKGGEDMRMVKVIIRVTMLTGAILLLLSKTAA